MTATERQGRRPVWADDGYDFLDHAMQGGWRPISSWGVDGWDLGSWPLISFSMRRRDDGLYDVVEHVEGDLTFLEGATEEEAHGWLDIKAVWFWLSGQTSSGELDEQLLVLLREHLVNEHGVTPVDAGNSPRYTAGVPWVSPTQVWDQHQEIHGVEHTDVVQLDGWLPEQYRGPFSWARCDAYHGRETT